MLIGLCWRACKACMNWQRTEQCIYSGVGDQDTYASEQPQLCKQKFMPVSARAEDVTQVQVLPALVKNDATCRDTQRHAYCLRHECYDMPFEVSVVPA